MAQMPPSGFIANMTTNPGVMRGGFLPGQAMANPQNTVVAPYSQNRQISPILDSVFVEETPKQTFQENMRDYAQRRQQAVLMNARKIRDFGLIGS